MRLLGVMVFTIVVTMLLSGCGERKPVNGSEGSAPSQTSNKDSSISKEELEKYVDRLPSLEAVFKSHNVRFQSSYSDEKEGVLEIRRIGGDHSTDLSDEEKAQFKQSIYEAIGSEFPLRISVYMIGEQPGMTGKITAIDKEGRFLVISSDRYLDKEEKMPDGAWYGMTDDALITFNGKELQAKDVKIGSSVKVWGEGMMLTSYPGQTSGLRLEITELDNGIGDESGIVTGVEKSGEGVNEEYYIKVDGIKYRLLQNVQVWIKDENVVASVIQIGDRVKIWFAGYELGPEKMVTQVLIER
ncbi:hypothetical protein EHS13_04255 [Paenibacillus psychroresistens]|uniref:DUF3221 domain-containing protein n=1 Tax=Paenibacillus psychroresistens TaxID=1778678 RepID=A0A6B8REL7_9BACL|nr:DUF3221 domain-containing protein [Paenibacillus psychroresistens]QGQ94174.1 hypothetical protein EHS13_04255 [Paenibacillus psychroresistens]